MLPYPSQDEQTSDSTSAAEPCAAPNGGIASLVLFMRLVPAVGELVVGLLHPSCRDWLLSVSLCLVWFYHCDHRHSIGAHTFYAHQIAMFGFPYLTSSPTMRCTTNCGLGAWRECVLIHGGRRAHSLSSPQRVSFPFGAFPSRFHTPVSPFHRKRASQTLHTASVSEVIFR